MPCFLPHLPKTCYMVTNVSPLFTFKKKQADLRISAIICSDLSIRNQLNSFRLEMEMGQREIKRNNLLPSTDTVALEPPFKLCCPTAFNSTKLGLKKFVRSLCICFSLLNSIGFIIAFSPGKGYNSCLWKSLVINRNRSSSISIFHPRFLHLLSQSTRILSILP